MLSACRTDTTGTQTFGQISAASSGCTSSCRTFVSARLDVEWPMDSKLECSLRCNVACCREIVCRFVRPSHVKIDYFQEYACTFPLDVDEYIYIWAISVFFYILVMEYSQHWIIRRGIPLGVITSVCSDLHLHDLLHYIKLQIISQVQCQHRQWKYLLV